VQALGGQIQVESQVGKGSTFRVLLPAASVTSPAAKGPAGPANNTVAVAGAQARVLIIDDEPFVAAALGRTLEPEHQVKVASTVREGRALIERGERFDVILCDLILPQTTGMYLYDDLLRTRPELACRVVFMAGDTLTPKATEFVASVSNRVLEKPFSAEALRGAVRQTLLGGGQ
jgi:DNA-binding NtrC family response regulator